MSCPAGSFNAGYPTAIVLCGVEVVAVVKSQWKKPRDGIVHGLHVSDAAIMVDGQFGDMARRTSDLTEYLAAVAVANLARRVRA